MHLLFVTSVTTELELKKFCVNLLLTLSSHKYFKILLTRLKFATLIITSLIHLNTK